MNKLERKALQKMVKLNERPIVTRALINDKLESADFRLGWKCCHERIAAVLRFIMSAKAGELKRYSDTPE